MTRKELSQLYWLNREIEMDQRRLRDLEAKTLPRTQTATSATRSSGMTDRVGNCAVEIADLRDIIATKRQKCLQERIRLERYIAGIKDSFLRQIFTYRFVHGMSWRQVADHVGGRNTADSVRKAVRRFLAEN